MSDVIAALTNRIATLEDEQRRLLRSVDGIRRTREPLLDIQLQVRKAITCEPSDEDLDYPVAGDTVYPIKFLDCDFLNVPGNQALNSVERQAEQATCAFSNSGEYIPVGTEIDVYQCRGLGDQDAGDWFILDGSGAGRLHRFRLKADLSNGGVNVLAKLVTFNGTNYVEGGDCYVFDWYALTGAPTSTRGMWQGTTNMEGIGLKREKPVTAGHTELDIVWMETYAWAGEVTLNEDPVFSGSPYTSTWSAAATVNKAFHQGVIPGTTITVYDDQVMYPFAKSGAVAKITRSEYEGENPYYKVLVCQQQALMAKATLSGAFCGTSVANIAGFEVLSPSPFNLPPVPLPDTAKATTGGAGLHGDSVILTLDKADGAYEIVRIEKHPLGVITSLQQDTTTGDWLQACYKTIYVELCSQEKSCVDAMLMRQFNWWCSGNYWCSGSDLGSGSGSGETGGDCDCTTIPSTLTVNIFNASGLPWDGGSVTITKSGGVWSGSGTIAGTTWTFTYTCSKTTVLGGTLRVEAPACFTERQDETIAAPKPGATNSCDPVHIEYQPGGSYQWASCGHVADSMAPCTWLYSITE